MLRIAMVGAQDTGKTTIAKELSSRFRAREYLTDYVEECARTYIGRWGEPVSTMADQLFILDKQIDRESYISPKCQLMFTDSPLTLSYVYALLVLDSPQSTKSRDIITHIYDKIIKYGTYDIYYYLTPFRSPTPDGIRSQTLIDRNAQIDLMIKSFLDLHQIKYVKISGPNVWDRIEQVDRLLMEHVKDSKIESIGGK
jgi:nicotinamide riboside kinase